MATPLPAATAATTAQDDATSWRVDDEVGTRLAPILTIDQPRKKPGRPRRDDRAICDGLIWLARSGAQWSHLPRAFGPKATLHERCSEWVATGAFGRAWAVLLRAYDGEIGLDWEGPAAAGCIVKAPCGTKGGRARRRRQAPPPPTAAHPAPSATGGPKPAASPAPGRSPGPTATP